MSETHGPRVFVQNLADLETLRLLLAENDEVIGRVKIGDGIKTASLFTQGTEVGLGTVILDDEGAPVTSFGSVTEYTDGGTPPANPEGPTLLWDDGGTWKHVSDTEPLPVTASIDTTGLALETKQDTQITHLSAIETAVEAIQAGQLADGHAVTVDNASIPVTGTFWQATQPVSAASLPLPTGASTSAKQDTIIGHLDGVEGHVDGIEGLLTTIDADTGGILTAVQLIDNIVGSINGPGAPVIDSYTQAPFNLAAGADQVLVASSANKQVWIYGIGFVLSAAGTVSFQDQDDTAITGVMPFAANSGMTSPPSGNFAMPLWKCGTDKDFEVDVVTAELDGWVCYAIVSV